MFTVLVVVLLLDALILAVSVLLQAGQGGGLASLGGGAGTEMLMGGRQAATILHKITWWTAGIFLFLALVPTHQLTPVAVLLATTGLVVFRACRLRWLPPFMAAAIGCWWMTGARVRLTGD